MQPQTVDGSRCNALISHVGKTLHDRHALYQKSIQNPNFWAEIAKEDYRFTEFWKDDNEICRYNFDKSKGPIFIRYFEGAKTNVCYNCLDRHDPEKVCFYVEQNHIGAATTLTYGQMLSEVIHISNILKFHYRIQKGDIVGVYLPVIPFTVQVMLACARIGAVVTVVFGGFSAAALTTRLIDAKVKLLITADVSRRGEKVISLKKTADRSLEALAKATGLTVPCLVFNNSNHQNNHLCPMMEGRDVWYHEAVAALPEELLQSCPIEWMNAEDPLFLLYTSGSTGKPKAILHTTAGYMVYAGTTFKYTFDYHERDVYFCTADVGWITGHSYLVYGPLLHGATSVLYEGLPNYPTASRWWEIIEKYQVSIFYTAPTAIRSLMQLGDHHVNKCNLDSLRVLGSVGEPINAEAWRWFYEVVGKGKADIVDTWWQTETGGHMITPLPGCTPLKPGCASLPFFGIQPVLLDPLSMEEKTGVTEGLLAIKAPWPGIARTLYNEPQKFEETYFSAKGGYYITGDGARRDSDGYIWITGRVDDVMNISGHRIGTSEVEDAVNKHPAVVESAVVGVPHDVKGESIYVFLTFRENTTITPKLLQEVKNTVRTVIGPLATPDVLHPAQTGLPKTRSGKIIRRVLRKIATEKYDDLGDVSTMANPEVIKDLIAAREKYIKPKAKV